MQLTRDFSKMRIYEDRVPFYLKLQIRLFKIMDESRNHPTIYILEKGRTDNCQCTKLDTQWAHDASGGLELPGQPVASSRRWKV